MSGSMFLVVVLFWGSKFDAVFHSHRVLHSHKVVVPRSVLRNLLSQQHNFQNQQRYIIIKDKAIKEALLLLRSLPCKTRGTGHSIAFEPSHNGWEGSHEDCRLCPCWDVPTHIRFGSTYMMSKSRIPEWNCMLGWYTFLHPIACCSPECGNER